MADDTTTHPSNASFFWRAVDEEELAYFRNARETGKDTYGLLKYDLDNTDGMKELLACKVVRDRRCVRMQLTKKALDPWASRGTFIKVDRDKLTDREFETVEGKPDVYVVGAAVVREGAEESSGTDVKANEGSDE